MQAQASLGFIDFFLTEQCSWGSFSILWKVVKSRALLMGRGPELWSRFREKPFVYLLDCLSQIEDIDRESCALQHEAVCRLVEQRFATAAGEPQFSKSGENKLKVLKLLKRSDVGGSQSQCFFTTTTLPENTEQNCTSRGTMACHWGGTL